MAELIDIPNLYSTKQNHEQNEQKRTSRTKPQVRQSMHLAVSNVTFDTAKCMDFLTCVLLAMFIHFYN